MPADNQNQGPDEAREQRAEVDPGKVDVARLRLAAIDRAVFANARRHAGDAHEHLLRRAVTRLFGHG
jgi:hypothetical protein